MRPTLARTSSAASGLRFCGMIDEPVVKASDRRDEAELRRHPQHDLLGQARQVGRADRGGRQRLQGEVASRDAVQANWRSDGRSPARAAVMSRSIGNGRAGQRRRAQRALVHPRPGVGEARGVAGEHLDIGHQVVAEGHRLGRLQVGEARHQGVGVRLGLGEEGALQRLDLRRPCGRRRRAPRGGNRAPPGRCASGRCAAARPPGRSARASRASTFMWMSSNSSRNGKVPAADLGLDACRGPPGSPRRRRLRSRPTLCQHRGVRARAREVLARQARSKPIETLIACIRSAGLAEKRPPHMLWPPFAPGPLWSEGSDMTKETPVQGEPQRRPLTGRTLRIGLWTAAALGVAGVLYVTGGAMFKPAGRCAPAAARPGVLVAAVVRRRGGDGAAGVHEIPPLAARARASPPPPPPSATARASR